jgi:hypothetical protein
MWHDWVRYAFGRVILKFENANEALCPVGFALDMESLDVGNGKEAKLIRLDPIIISINIMWSKQ